MEIFKSLYHFNLLIVGHNLIIWTHKATGATRKCGLSAGWPKQCPFLSRVTFAMKDVKGRIAIRGQL